MLLHLYYFLYEKSSKKCSELSDLYKRLEDAYEFENDGLKYLRNCGTRWIFHKGRTIRLVIDKFGL